MRVKVVAVDRTKIFATRRDPNPAYLPTILEQISSVNANRFPFEVEDSYEKLRDWNHQTEIKRAIAGRDDATVALRPIIDRAIDERQRRSAPAGALDVDVEAATIALDLAHAWSAVPYWIAKAGVAFALRALVRAHAFEPSHYEHGYGSGKIWITESWRYATQLDADHGWHVLRGCIARADDRAYANARRIAEELRASVPLTVRVSIAFAFPTETDWANADAEAALAMGRTWEGSTAMLMTIADAPLAERLAKLSDVYLDDAWIATIVARHAERAARVIRALIEAAGRADLRKVYAQGLAAIDSPEAAEAFVSCMTDKAVLPIAAKYFKAHPELARAALAAAAKGSGKTAAAASLALESVAEKAAEKSESRALVKTAKPCALPRVLATPPWEAKRAPPVVIEGLAPLPFKPHLVWAKGERERLRKGLAEWERERKDKGGITEASTDDKLLAWLRRSNGMPLFWIAHITDTKRAMQLWETQRTSFWWSGPQRSFPMLLARHGLATLPGFLRFGDARAAEAIDGLARFVTPAVAPFMADVRLRLKSVRAAADRWLLDHPEMAAIALVPRAVGKSGKGREAAESALLLLREHGHGAIALRVASRYGKNVASAVAAIDPLLAYPAKLPKLPSFARARVLPPPELRAKSGGALPEDAVRALLMMLAFYNPSAPYVGLAQVKAACTAESLRAFAWTLFERWLAAGAPPKEAWAFEALGLFGDDGVVAKLSQHVRAWPKERAIARAALGLEILGRIGTDRALAQIDSIARSFRFASIKEKAHAMITEAAARRGLTQDELADRVAPDLDGASIDGPLKKDEKAVASQQAQRLERAMCDERTWSKGEFDAFIVRHRLVGQLARRLLFSASQGKKTTLFRVAEDGSLADLGEKTIALAKTARVAIVHPLRLPADAVTRWSSIFADYEILQPFEQLARATFGPPKDLGAGLTLEPRRVRGLLQRGWERDGDSWVGSLVKRAGAKHVVVTLEPGFDVAGKDVEAQKVKAVTLHEDRARIPMKRMDPIAYSELRRELG